MKNINQGVPKSFWIKLILNVRAFERIFITGDMRVSMGDFEEGRRVLCQTAWLHDDPCDPLLVPRIFSLASNREHEREAAKESILIL